MLKFVGRRVLQAVPLIIVATMLIFAAVSVAGDPLDRYRLPNVPQSTLDAKAAELGLDRPIYERYWDWVTDAVHGDFGTNASGLPVGKELLDRGLVSLRLIALAVIVAILVAIIVGFYTAVRRGRTSERMLMGFTILMLTAPEFWLAVIVKELAISFNQHTGTNFLATVGDSTPGIATSGFADRMSDYAGHLALPTLVLILHAFPVWALYQRAAMLEVVDSDYVTMARAKGLSNRAVLVKHALRTSLIPLVTMVALRLPWIIGGLVVIESIFGWRGLGRMLIEGIQKQDTNTVLAFLLMSAIIITALNITADLIHRYLDPRVRDA